MSAYVQVSISNGKRQCNFSGQRDRLKILPRAGTGRDSLSQSGTGRGTRQSPIFCQNPGRNRDGTGQSLIFPTIFCFRTSFSCLSTSFSCFFVPLGKWFVPGRPRTEGFVPGHLLLPLSRDKRDTGTRKCVCPGTKGQQDVPSRGNTSMQSVVMIVYCFSLVFCATCILGAYIGHVQRSDV